MRTHPAVLLLFAAAPLFGQEPESRAPAATDPLIAGREKLQKALAKAAATADTAFEVEWADKTKADGNKDAIAVFLNRGPSATTNTGTLRGSWHQGLTHLRLDGEGVKDELLLAGRRMIAKDDKTDWVLRVGRFADGNQTGFLPDVQLLLTQLAMWPLAVTQRTVGSLDDRPIEIFSVTLNPDQVADASFTDLIPESLASTANPFAQLLRIQAVGNGKPLRQPLQKPESTIDIAIFVDPATGTVHQLRFRSWTKQDPRFANAGRAAIVVRNGVAQQVGPAEEDEDEDENAKADAPLQYEGGLPERRRKNMTVREYTVKLTGHGQTAAPELSDKQRQLLGLPPR